MLVQAFVPEAPVETLDVRVLDRLAWPDEVQLHAIPVCPFIEHLAFELRPVIHRNRQRKSPQIGQPVEYGRNATPGNRGVDLDRRALAAVVVHDRQAPKLPAITQAIGY